MCLIEGLVVMPSVVSNQIYDAKNMIYFVATAQEDKYGNSSKMWPLV